MVQKLTDMLELRGIKQAAFERSVFLSENRISKWKKGQGEPSASEALRMARALGVSVEWLIDDAGETAPAPELSELDRAVIDLVHALGLEKGEALRRLASPSPQPNVVYRPNGAEEFPPAGFAPLDESPAAARTRRAKRSG